MRLPFVWLLFPAVLLAEDVSLPALVTVHVLAGRGIGAESHGVPLPDTVVQGLLRMDVSKRKDGAFTATIPVTKSAADYPGLSSGFCGSEQANATAAAGLTVKKALEKEQRLKSDARDIATRSALILFAGNQTSPEMEQMRYRQIAWLVANEPAAAVLCQPEAMISKAQAPQQYAEVKEFWLKAVQAKPHLNTLESAVNFLIGSDAEDAYRVILPFVNQTASIRARMGEVYALGAIGLTEWGRKNGLPASATPTFPTSAFATSARATLEQSSDLVMLMSAQKSLTDAGSRLKLGNGLPDGLLAFCESIAARIRALKPNSENDCEFSQDPPLTTIERYQEQKRQVTKVVEPRYSDAAKRQGIQGTVILHVNIDKQGRVKEVEFLKGPFLLYPEAVAAIRKWEFKPHMRNSKAVEASAYVEVVFHLL